MKADKTTVFDLFDRQRQYAVPLYQRQYVWPLEGIKTVPGTAVRLASQFRRGTVCHGFITKKELWRPHDGDEWRVAAA